MENEVSERISEDGILEKEVEAAIENDIDKKVKNKLRQEVTNAIVSLYQYNDNDIVMLIDR